MYKAPNISGHWELKVKNLIRNKNKEPSFNDINELKLELEVTQKGRFVIVKMPKHPTRPVPGYRIGSWTLIHINKKSYWKLVLADDDDNGTSEVTIKRWKGNIPFVLEGFYLESGFSQNNPIQKQVVDHQIWKRKNKVDIPHCH